MKTLPQTEKQFQAAVVEYAKLRGYFVYHTFDSRRSEPGFPDLVVVHPETGKVAFIELKLENNRPTTAQNRWLDALRVAELFNANMAVRIYRPGDWPLIERDLR